VVERTDTRPREDADRDLGRLVSGYLRQASKKKEKRFAARLDRLAPAADAPKKAVTLSSYFEDTTLVGFGSGASINNGGCPNS